MRNRDFNDAGQARNYLSQCIIRVDDEPVFVHDVIGDGRNMVLSCSDLSAPNTRARAVKIKDKSIDMNPVPLGMCLYFDGKQYRTFYVSRYPARIWRVGLARDNVSVSHLLGKGSADDYFDKLFTSQSMTNCIKGKYDSLEKISDMFQQYGGVIPFSRRFAVALNSSLLYKTIPEVVGTWTPTKGPKLSEAYTYLQEALQEDIH